MFLELIGVLIVAAVVVIAVLVTPRDKSCSRNEERLPNYEILARGMEDAANALIAVGKSEASRGLTHDTRISFAEAERLFDGARRIRKEAMQDMANGEFL